MQYLLEEKIEDTQKVINSRVLEKVINSRELEKVINSRELEKVINSRVLEKVINSRELENVINSRVLEKDRKTSKIMTTRRKQRRQAMVQNQTTNPTTD